MSSTERNGEKSGFDFTRYAEYVTQGAAITFGTDEPHYEKMLEESGMGRNLRLIHQPRVLLIGCAPASFLEFMRFIDSVNPHSKVTIVDISAFTLNELNKTIGEKGMDMSKVQLARTDARKMGLAGNTYDAAFTHMLIHNILDDDPITNATRVLGEANRVLKPGGAIFLIERENFSEQPSARNPIDTAINVLEKTGFQDSSTRLEQAITRDEYNSRHNITTPSGSMGRWGVPWYSIASYGIK